MTRLNSTALAQALVFGALAAGALAAYVGATARDTPPAASAASSDNPPDAGKGRHHNPTWAACKKQADDQKLAPGDARKDFMKSCIKSAKDSAPPASQ